ncbi:hypothetical protein OKW24_005209 [Peribacillus simplex]|nr:hypothetical protein [Peribacillus simplex]
MTQIASKKSEPLTGFEHVPYVISTAGITSYLIASAETLALLSGCFPALF